MNNQLLAYKEYAGSGTPLLILHGLFGSGKNWVTIAKHLSQSTFVYTLDARNHGESFRADTHSLDDMVNDLQFFIQEKIRQPVILLGHSMGGLTSMAYALKNQDYVRGLIVVDIAPRMYFPDYSSELAAQKIDLSVCKSRSEIDTAMKQFVADEALRKFLQTNVTTKADGSYAWQINIEPIEKSEKRTSFPQIANSYAGPTLFVRGLKSNFIRDDDLPVIKRYFPNAEVVNIPNGDHWLHFTAQKDFLAVVDRFLSESGAKA